MRFLLPLLMVVSLSGQEAKPQETKPAEAATAAQEAKPAAEARPAEAAAESPVPTAEQNVSGTIDVGYRWLGDVRGNFNSYRSVVDLGEGPKLFGLDLSFEDPGRRLFDRLDVRGTGWGGDPYTTARVDARRNGWYHFTADYRNLAYFNFLPSFANPGLERGILLNQRSFDIHRRFSSFEIDLRPGSRVVPFLGYSRDSGFGRGITDFVAAGNEYPVATSLRDSMNRYRGGVRLEFNRFHVTLEQGGTAFKDDQSVFTADRNPGNRTTPLFGQQLFLSSLSQNYGIRGDSIYSKVLATANPVSWVNLHGQFLFSQPKTDVSYQSAAAGNFAILSQLLFYNGSLENGSGLAKQPHTSASGGAEIRPLRRLRIVESISTDRLHNASFGVLAESLLLGTAGPSNLAPLARADRLIWNYNRQQLDVLFDVANGLTLRGGHRYVWGDSTVRAGNLFADRTGLESAQTRSHAGLAGATYRRGARLSVHFDYEAAAAEHDYFRISLHDYNRARIRTRFQAVNSLGFGYSFSLLDNENPAPTINYDFQQRDNTFTVFWTPQGNLKPVNLVGEYTRYTLRSGITYLNPSTLARERSFYQDRGHSASSVLEIAVPGAHSPRFGLGGALFISTGSRPAQFYQPMIRMALPLHKNVHFTSEWRYYGFGEDFYRFEGFNTRLFQLGLRFVR